MITNPDYMITDRAYDALMAIHRRHNKVFAMAYAGGGLRNLCRAYKIDPDA